MERVIDSAIRFLVLVGLELSLNDDLPESYDKASFDSKVYLLMNHFCGYGSSGIWVDRGCIVLGRDDVMRIVETE